MQQFPNMSNLVPEYALFSDEAPDSSNTTNESNPEVNRGQGEYLSSSVGPERNTVVKYKLQNDDG